LPVTPRCKPSHSYVRIRVRIRVKVRVREINKVRKRVMMTGKSVRIKERVGVRVRFRI
jgi:hypothetical protein